MTGRPDSAAWRRPTSRTSRPGRRSSAENYQRLLERVPAIIYIADAGEVGRWHYVSPQIEAILGFTPEEWCADPELWAERLHPGRPRRGCSAARRQRAGGPRESDGRAAPSTGCATATATSSGSATTRMLVARPRRRALRWHGVLSDITERKRAEAELERRAAQQSAVARLGEHALEGATTAELMHEAVAAAAEILDVEIAAVFELARGRGRARPARAASAGRPTARWTCASRPAPARSPATRSLTGAPVVVEDWTTETRFAQSALSLELGARSGAVGGDRGPPAARSACSSCSRCDAALLRARRRRLPAGAGQRARRRARAPGDRGPDPPPGAARRAHRPAQPRAVPRPARSGARRGCGAASRWPRSCSSISTTSSSSTTASAIRSATSCSPRWRRGSSRRCG